VKDHKTWQSVSFTDVFSNRKTNRIIGLSFPANSNSLGLEPSVLSVLPQGNNVEYSSRNIDFNDGDVRYYVCSVYISGMEEFRAWASRHDQTKIIVGGYHPSTFPEDFKNLANKIVVGLCDDLFATIFQDGQIVQGIVNNASIPRYDLYDVNNNQQIIPDKKPLDIVTSINTSNGCPCRCDFCCSPILCPTLVSKPIKSVTDEVFVLKQLCPDYLFIRDENFPLQSDWRERLYLISDTGAKLYLFASANLITNEMAACFKRCGVYMVCLGLEDISVEYTKNANLDKAVAILKKYGIYVYLSFIVNPLKIMGVGKGEEFYGKLMKRFEELAPEMVCGNFLMPFRGTKLWDEYYAYVQESDFKEYDSKSAFLVKNPVVRAKMEFFMFWYQYLYYTSDFYNTNVRKFKCNDTLSLRFEELYDEFRPKYERLWNVRA